MGELTHKAARAAFGGAIDLAMRKMDKDREKGLLDLVDLTERFMGDNFQLIKAENFFYSSVYLGASIICGYLLLFLGYSLIKLI